ncbi:hypothetical protein P280DRAFT_547369 [Massarina eburnea CBS 473.64]|uniref:Uncharacterized protein n=1 Tax=Massarina eburnea CBS 473.64 TaxID=1395130 RepID=A0A6A6S5L8_9PLEO|nr:hypothetical protein P280DRAFT_547369 [Massarina eburnea CBS 473.64]
MAEVAHLQLHPPTPKPKHPPFQILDPFSVDEESRIESSSANSERVDSAVEISPTSPTTPTRVQYTSFEPLHVLYPPLITGHGRLVRTRQTVPSWMGALVVISVLGWTVWCALHVSSLLGGHTR